MFTKISNTRRYFFLAVIIALFCGIFGFNSQKIFAIKAQNYIDGEINWDLWDVDLSIYILSKGKTAVLNNYNKEDEDNDLTDIVIPNVADFKEKYPDSYANLEKVYIKKNAMRKAATNANKKGGKLSISKNGSGDGQKVFAYTLDIGHAYDVFWDEVFCGFNKIEEIDLIGFDTNGIKSMKQMFDGCSSLKKIDLSSFDTSNVTNMEKMFSNSDLLTLLDLSSFDTGNIEEMTQMFYSEDKALPLLIITNDEKLKAYDYEKDNRILFTTTLKVDGKNVKFKGGDESDFVSYNDDKTEKYINIYESFTTTDNQDEILKKLKNRLKQEKKNLKIANGYEFNCWEAEEDYEYYISDALGGIYKANMIKSKEQEKSNNDDNQEKNRDYSSEGRYSWNTINDYSSNKNSESQEINKNQELEQKTLRKIKLPEKLRTQKYLTGYPDGTIGVGKNMTRAEFLNVAFRLINNGEAINYIKLDNIDDVKNSDWYSGSIAYLVDKNIIYAVDKKIFPKANITRNEVNGILYNILKFYDINNEKLRNYSYEQFEKDIKDLGINSYGDKNGNITRAEVAQMIYCVFDRNSVLGKKSYLDLNKDYWAYKFIMDASE